MTPDLLQRRVAALEAAFRHIALTRMAGVPILHPGLAVQALGFAAEPGEDGRAGAASQVGLTGQTDQTGPGGLALGVLITPWFMNLVRLPLHALAEEELPQPGLGAAHAVGGWSFDFFGGHEEGLGRYAAASLFSPMAEFVDQAAAVATAREVLLQLRPVRPPPAEPVPARRGFLFGRSAATGAPK